MKMTVNDAILRYNLIAAMKFIDGDYSISRDLKIKLIRYKIDLEKVKNDFVAFQEKAMEEIKTEEYKTLFNKENKTEEENQKLVEIANGLNEELGKLISNKTMETVNVKSFEFLTEDEFNEILSVNIENSPVINSNQLDANTYVELIHNVFVK